MSKPILGSGRVTRVFLSLSTAVLLSGAGMVVPLVAVADHTTAHTIQQLQAQIAALSAQLTALQVGQAAPVGKCTVTRDLSQGVRGDDVKCLQQYLNSTGNKVADTGPGSPGNETTFYGSLTKAAVAKWQAANGVSPAAGYFGPISRAKYSSLVAGAPTPAPTPTPGVPPPPAAVTGTALTVSVPAQPGDALAPLSASRIPATRFTVTAGADGAVRINSVTVERQGPSSDTSVKEVVLLDEDSLQIGLAKTLSSVHQSILNEPVTVNAGQSRTLSVAINRPASGSDGGDIVKMAVVAIDAGAATVSGPLPIVGSPLTMNSTLTIGAATLSRGVQDPGSAQTKEIGTKGYILAALRVTAGSAEDVSFKWVSWNQIGSAGASDLSNVKVVVDGTEYAAKVSSDGKYYTANFGAGINIVKGSQKEAYIKADIEGGSNRTIDFDLYRFTDLFVVGKQFGYGITPSGGSAGSAAAGSLSSDSNPAYNAFVATIGAGTIDVTKSTVIPAQNIALNLEDQPLGAFDVEVKGEPVTSSSIVFRISKTGGTGGTDGTQIDNVKLVNNTTGAVVAGPKDVPASATLTFTDSVTFPVGKRAYVLKGKLTTNWSNDDTIAASTTPSSSWTSITGSVSGQSITASPTTAVTGNTMTVKTATTSLSILADPASQNVVAGAKTFTFAKIVFDSTASGEDVRFTSAQFNLETDTGSSNPTACQLFDGPTALNTGTNVQNPTSDGQKTFTLDNNLTVPKGTVKTISLKCDIAGSATADDTIEWRLTSGASFGATGLISGNTVTPSFKDSTNDQNKMIVKAGGTLSVALDGSSPSVRLTRSSTADNTLAVLRISATNEAVDLRQITFQLSSTASNTPQDLSKVTLWDGATKVGEVIFTTDFATATLSTILVPKGGDRVLTIKGDVAEISGVPGPAKPGHLVIVDWDADGGDGSGAGTYGVGQESSTNVRVARGGSDTASAGVRIFRGVPTLAKLSAPAGTIIDTEMKLYRFSVSAPSGSNGVSLYKFTFQVSTSGSGATGAFAVKSPKVFAFTDSAFSQPAYSSAGQLNNGSTLAPSEWPFDAYGNTFGHMKTAESADEFPAYFNPSSPTSAQPEVILIPAGETRYFEFRGTVSGSGATSSVSVRLLGDEFYNSGTSVEATPKDLFYSTSSPLYDFATSAPVIDFNDGDSNFVWSGNSTTSVNRFHHDWVNGFVLSGLPAAGMDSQTFSK